MGNEFFPAISALRKKLDVQLKEAAETKRAINMLLKFAGEPPEFSEEAETSGLIRADQFYGKQLATAAADFLEMRKEARQPTDILAGLQAGGFDFTVMGWKEGDELRMLALSLAKNNAKFHKLKNGSFGLRSWYDEEFLKKAGKQKAVATAAAAAASAAQVSSKDENAEPDEESGDLE